MQNKQLAEWLTFGDEWLNDCLATGMAVLSPTVQEKAQQWSEHATVLGFQTEANLVEQLLNHEHAINIRTQAMSELIVRLDLTMSLYELNEIKQKLSVAESNGTI